MSIFKGSGVAIITPYTEDGIDYKAYETLLNWHVQEGTDAIIVCGTTGEASTMTEEEKKEIIKFTVEKIAKRIPVIAGTGTNNTKASIEMSKYAESVGADGLLVITPYYNKTTSKGLIEHFTAIADSVNIPLVLYNVPSRTGLNMSPDVLEKLSHHKNIVAIKEASGNISQVAEIARLCGDRLAIYSGNDDQIVPLLSLGGLGVISVVANICPKDTHDMVIKYLEGDLKESLRIQLTMKPLIDSLFTETNPIPVKTAVSLMGLNGGLLRLPLTTMEERNLQLLKVQMYSYGLKIVGDIID